MKSVAILLFPEVLLLDVAGPTEVFSIANRYLPPDEQYRISTISSTDSISVRASNGIQLQADYKLSDAPLAFDLLLVPGGPGAYNGEHSELLPWLRRAAEASRRHGSICTGAFILGEAGLLDGRQATTHWNYIERLARLYPSACIGTDQIYIRDDRLFTSGGVTAGIDMALGILAEDHDRRIAVSVAKVLLVAMKRQGGQAQFSPMLGEVAREESPINQIQQHMLEHLDTDLCVEGLASLAGMSARNFARVFVRETGLTPMEFVQSARIDRARHLLETSDLPLKTVAYRSGFRSVRCMRGLFSERLGLTPMQYRHQFG